ncbi:MAG: hypothetical protein KDA77_16795, partial [Planctomycetaceae bacterium]|nr:hypothetical protein [Planctomycetaceae bacterium]
MKTLISCGIWGLCLTASVSLMVAGEKEGTAESASTQKLWKQIAPYFEPPSEFKGDLGNYKTPLKFYDGRPVKTP